MVAEGRHLPFRRGLSSRSWSLCARRKTSLSNDVSSCSQSDTVRNTSSYLNKATPLAMMPMCPAVALRSVAPDAAINFGWAGMLVVDEVYWATLQRDRGAPEKKRYYRLTGRRH